jgi:hypothetical protein
VSHVAYMGENRNAHKMLDGTPKGKCPFRRPMHIWEDNIKIVVKQTGCEDVDWIHLTHDRVQ